MLFVEDTKMFEFTKLIDFGSMCVNSLDCSIYINLFSSITHGFKEWGGNAALIYSGAAVSVLQCMGQTSLRL